MIDRPPHGVERRLRERRFLLVLGHMRSYSTLLAHVLGSHPEIDGYSELHRSYLGRLDLHEMTRHIEEATGERRRGRYALDKLLHDRLVLDPVVLARPELRAVILVRRPESAIASIVRTTRAKAPHMAEVEPRAAAAYYAGRLRSLDRYGEALGPRGAFVEAERLVDDTEAVLAHLTKWLELDPPLSASYRLFRHSGTVGHGDPSQRILAGTVLHDGERCADDALPVDVPDDAMRAAVDAWREVVPALRARHGIAG